MYTSKEFYHGRDYSPIVIGLSAASTWTWAPALILSSDIAANSGFIGSLSFIIPNIMALLLFAIIGRRIHPITIWENPVSKGIYHLGYGAVEFFCVLIQVTAGANILSKSFGINYNVSIVIFIVIALIISWFKGLHGTIISNVYEQIFLIGASCVILIASFSIKVDAPIVIGQFNPGESLMFTLILLSGPIMTHQHWQRAQRTGYIWSSLFFGIPLVCLSGVGILSGITGQYVSLTFFRGTIWSILLVFIILSGLASTLQSAFTSIIGIFGGEETITLARKKMLMLATVTIFVIMNNINIMTLWKSMGIFRVVLACGVLAKMYVISRRKNSL